MFCVPVDDNTKILCNNESVVNTSSKLGSTLNKRHCSLAYHAMRWAVTASIAHIRWIPGHINIADAISKRLSKNQLDKLFGDWFY